MAEKTYDKIEYRVNAAIPEWKEWARRLRRIYASLEDIGSKQEAIQDAVEQWGWEWASIQKLWKAHPTFNDAVEEYRKDGDYPKKKHWVKRVTASELKTVYMREGELTSFASLDENPKATTFHASVVAANGMLDLSEPYGDRDDLVQPDSAPENPSSGSGLANNWDED